MDNLLKNKWVIGGAFGLLLLILLLRGGGGSASPGSLGVASQATATNANVQLAALQTQLGMEQDTTAGQVNVQDTGAQVTALGIVAGFLSNQDNNNVARDNIAAGITMNQANNATAIQVNNTDQSTYAMVAPRLATIGAQQAEALASIQANAATTIAGINGSNGLATAQVNNSGALGRQLAASGFNFLNNLPGWLGGITGLFGGGGGGGSTIAAFPSTQLAQA